MGNDSFCKCSHQDIITQVNLDKKNLTQKAEMNINSNSTVKHNKIRKNTNNEYKRQKSILKKDIGKNNIVKIKRNIAATKITLFFREIKIKNKLNNNKLIISPFIEITNEHTSSFSQGKQIKLLSNLINKHSIYLGPKIKETGKNGFGILKWLDSPNEQSNIIAVYRGEFKNNQSSGFGRLSINTIGSFEGEFDNNLANGFGVYTHLNGSTYTGYWVNDLQDLYGIEHWNDNSFYEGEYSKGKKSGIGTYKWNDGTIYKGEWSNNTVNGIGILFYSDKERFYIGNWVNNMKEGIGEYITSKRKYWGMFKNDKKEGFGIMYWMKENKAFIGFWKEGKRIGIGKCLTDEKKIYGFWSDKDKVDCIEEKNIPKLLKYAHLEMFIGYFQFGIEDVEELFKGDLSQEYNTLL